jgi:hypothetical protein
MDQLHSRANQRKVNNFGFTILNSRSTRSRLAAYAQVICSVALVISPPPAVRRLWLP